MRKIFIDANIYLGFYNSNKPEFKKLLKSLEELSDKILIPYNVIYEVNRNKLNVFRDSIDNYIKQATSISTILPIHLENEKNQKIKNWNKQRKEIEENLRKLNDDLIEIIGQIILDISLSKDTVSITLQRLFSKPLVSKENTIKRARHRKELGNPPGKMSDPLGDQVNWLQILENLKNVDALWIVTNDTDYFTEYNKKLYLNPVLYSELIKLNSKIEVYVYNKLSDALKSFNEQELVKSLPLEKELSLISKEEPEPSPIMPNFIYQQITKFYGGGKLVPANCTFCGAKDTYKDAGYRNSQFGGLTYHYICTACNNYYDTGEFWE